MYKYVGCKIDRDKVARNVKLTQPIFIQSFEGEFELPEGGRTENIHVLAETVLNPDAEAINVLDVEALSSYRTWGGSFCM